MDWSEGREANKRTHVARGELAVLTFQACSPSGFPLLEFLLWIVLGELEMQPGDVEMADKVAQLRDLTALDEVSIQ